MRILNFLIAFVYPAMEMKLALAPLVVCDIFDDMHLKCDLQKYFRNGESRTVSGGVVAYASDIIN